VVLFLLSACTSQPKVANTATSDFYSDMVQWSLQRGTGLSSEFPAGDVRSSYILRDSKDTANNSPIVLVLGGSEGGTLKSRTLAKAIIANGYSVASIAYHQAPGTPPYVKEIPIESIVKRIKDVSTDDKGNQRCVAILGVSKGAELALLIAAYTDFADATIAVVPSSVVWQSNQITLARNSSWRVNDEPLPFVEYPWFSRGMFAYLTKGPIEARALHEAGIENTKILEQASIPVERISKPVLLQGAKLDSVWQSHEMSQDIMERVNNKNPDHQFTLLSYELDHFLTLYEEPVDDALKFITETFDRNPRCKGN
jgi:acetyl esterase/lipase